MRYLLPILLPFIMVLDGDAGLGSQRPRLGIDARITATPVLLDPAQPNRKRVGALTYLGGWVLESADPAFGGFSAMAIDRGALMLVSDAGNIVRLAIDSRGAIRGSSFGDLPGGPGPGDRKRDRDSESITLDPQTGLYWAGFERFNAIARYSPGFGRMEAIATPVAMQEWPHNGGAEAMVRLHSGRFLVFSEAAGERGRNDALMFAGDPADPVSKPVRFQYRTPAGYRVTDAAQLADSRVILLHRRVSLPDYFSAKVAILDPSLIREGATVSGKEVASFIRPMTVDNMEAMAVTRENRRTILWIGSDDNFKGPFQRTLLMKFALD